MKINTSWFQDRLADKEISQRKFAKMMDMDPAAVSYMLAGKRKMQMDEAIGFATIVGVPLEEVMAQAGLRVPTDGRGMCSVVGQVDAAGELRTAVDAPRRVALPPDAPRGTVAVRFKTPNTAAEVLDGWILYYSDGIKVVPANAIGRLCVATIAGRVLVGVVRKGYARGTYTLHPWTPGGSAIENVQVDRAAPVLWVRTSA